MYAAVVVLSLPDFREVERVVLRGRQFCLSIPDILAFREGPALVWAFKHVQTVPDLVVFDGHGIAHPRNFGLASHIGLLLDVPSIGCAKEWLCGDYEEVGREAGSQTPLELDGETVGAVVRTRTNANPMFVSPGHRMGVRSATALLLECCTGYRIPEPIRRAYQIVNELRAADEAKWATEGSRQARYYGLISQALAGPQEEGAPGG